MDSIIARGLSFNACHGVLEGEKTTPQLFQVDLELFLDLQAAGQQDDLNLTVDYEQVYKLVQNVVEGPSCSLIEALAEKIAQALLKRFPLLAVEVIVYKPEAPVEGEFQYFAVKIRRKA
ncbi:MAG TPA: dihydroneopterin aldolase [Syntrophomonas sp.]|jgi:dihydroneopterin aldolase|nr:dihydroneopterin aldolase [Syntrophomonas sp.]